MAPQNSVEDTKVVNRELFDYLKSKKQVAKCNTDPIVQELIQFLEKKIDAKDIKTLEQVVRNFTNKLAAQWKLNSGCINRFTKSNPDWFEEPLNLEGGDIEEEKDDEDKVKDEDGSGDGDKEREEKSNKKAPKRKAAKEESEVKQENGEEEKESDDKLTSKKAPKKKAAKEEREGKQENGEAEKKVSAKKGKNVKAAKKPPTEPTRKSSRNKAA